MSLLEHVVPEQFRATPEVIKERRTLCNSCHVRKSKTGSCGKLIIGSRVVYKNNVYQTCGCITDEKSVLKNEKCDLGKW